MQVAPFAQSSLYFRTVLFVTLVCATMLGLNVMEIWRGRDSRLQQAKTETANLARSLAQHAQDVFEDTDATLKELRVTVVDDLSEPAALARLARRMRARVVNQEVIQRLFLYDENSNWLASSLDATAFARLRDLKYADREYFQYHRDHAEDVDLVGPPIQNKLDNAWIVTITRRLYHPGGEFAGVVGASIGLDLFQRFFQTFDIGKQGAISLTSERGTLIARRPFDANNIGQNVAPDEIFRAVRDNASAGNFEFVSLLDGTTRLGSFHRVSGFNLIMIVALDENEVLASWRHDAQVHLAWMATIVAVVLFSGYQITLQIRQRAMAEAQLALSQQTLERRVVERTTDLQQMVNQRDHLVREVYHRVNNNMQVVGALLAMEAKQLGDAEARQALTDMRTRVYTLGLAHQQLMLSTDLETFDIAPFLRELVTKTLAGNAYKGIHVTTEIISFLVTLDFAVPLGLIVSELITSYFMQPHLSGNDCVMIRLQRNKACDVVLTVSDNRAAPVIAEPSASARRARLLRGLVQQIDGTLTLHDEHSMRYEVVFANPGAPK